jgi:hypothetical protein
MIGGQLSKYCGKEKAYDLMDQSIEMWKRFHPDPSKLSYTQTQQKNQTLSNLTLVFAYLVCTILVQITCTK